MILDDCPSITAFHHSAYQNLPLLFREFLDTRAHDINIYNELGESGLSKACAAGHNDMVLTLLQYGSDVNLPNMYTRITPLMTAAYHGHGDIIRILARNDADATLRDMCVWLINNDKMFFPYLVKLSYILFTMFCIEIQKQHFIMQSMDLIMMRLRCFWKEIGAM